MHYLKHLDPKCSEDELRAALAFDFSHEFILASDGMHLRHVERTFLCGGGDNEASVETTPYGGVKLCPACEKQVPSYVKWKAPKKIGDHGTLDIPDLCKLLKVELILSNDRPEVNDTGAAPCGAILGMPLNPPKLYMGFDEKTGKPLPVHRIGALHELTHLLCSPHGFHCEPGTGLYAVQYALGLYLPNNKEILKSTQEVQGISYPVYGGLMQARAWALGFLDSSRNVDQGLLYRASDEILFG